MNIDELKHTWQQQPHQDEAGVDINTQTLSAIVTNQHKQRFRNMLILRWFEAAVFLFFNFALWSYIANNIIDPEITLISSIKLTAPVISAFILTVFAIIGFAGSVGQIILINGLDYSKPVNELQTNILKITSHKLQVTKLMFLSAPFYLAYVFLGFDVFFAIDFYQLISANLMTAYLVTSALMFVFVLFMAMTLNYKNIHKPWVKTSIEFLIGKHLIEMSGVVNSLDNSQD